MNFVVEPTFDTIDCTLNRNEVVLLIHIGNQKPSAALKNLLVKSVKTQQNYKIFLLEEVVAGYLQSSTYLLVKNILRDSDKIKIVFYTHWSDVSELPDCKKFVYMMEHLKLIQLPYTLENFGFVLVFDTLHPMDVPLEYCVVESYKGLNCQTLGCSAVEVLMHKSEVNDEFTNIIAVEMSPVSNTSSINELQQFINQRLTFTGLSASDVDVFGGEVLAKLKDFYRHNEENTVLRNKDSNAELQDYIPTPEDISAMVKDAEVTNAVMRFKRQSIEKVDFSIHMKFLDFLKHFATNKFTERIRSKMLRLIRAMDKEAYNMSVQLICRSLCDDHPLPTDAIMVEKGQICPNSDMSSLWESQEFLSSRDYTHRRNIFLKAFAISLHAEHSSRWDNFYQEYTVADGALFYANLKSSTRTWVQNVCGRTFQKLAASLQFTWHPTFGHPVEATLDEWISELTEWMDAVPIVEGGAVTWQNFSSWISRQGTLDPGASVNDTRIMFEFSQAETYPIFQVERRHNLKSTFQQMLRELLLTFGRNVAAGATQVLATTKVERVDSIVAALDRSFVEGLKKLHLSMAREQWIPLRPPIFYHLTKFQQARQNFNDFNYEIDLLFGVHHFERPTALLAELQTVEAEFEIYQAKLGRYINGSINTAQEWGKEFRESTEYIQRNSGAQPTSLINDAARWMIRRSRSEIFSSYDYGGSLMLLNWVVRQFLKVKRMWK